MLCWIELQALRRAERGGQDKLLQRWLRVLWRDCDERGRLQRRKQGGETVKLQLCGARHDCGSARRCYGDYDGV